MDIFICWLWCYSYWWYIRHSKVFNEKPWYKIMFGFIFKMFIAAIGFIGFNVANAIPLKCVSINNKECWVRSAMIKINYNEPLFHPCSVLVNKCSSSYNDINNRYAKLCIPDVVKAWILKYVTRQRLMKTHYVCWHETWACMCRLDANVW